jgi:hypothetical protein
VVDWDEFGSFVVYIGLAFLPVYKIILDMYLLKVFMTSPNNHSREIAQLPDRVMHLLEVLLGY